MTVSEIIEMCEMIIDEYGDMDVTFSVTDTNNDSIVLKYYDNIGFTINESNDGVDHYCFAKLGEDMSEY